VIAFVCGASAPIVSFQDDEGEPASASMRTIGGFQYATQLKPAHLIP
jgi:hypothetical protein